MFSTESWCCKMNGIVSGKIIGKNIPAPLQGTEGKRQSLDYSKSPWDISGYSFIATSFNSNRMFLIFPQDKYLFMYTSGSSGIHQIFTESPYTFYTNKSKSAIYIVDFDTMTISCPKTVTASEADYFWYW